MRHPNVVKPYGTCVSPKPMVLMAHAPQGNLQDAVDGRRFKATEDVLRLLAGVRARHGGGGRTWHHSP